ncbi:MAG: hypothetical protein AAFR97_15950, partial [Bacteroidota bacterium]
TTGQTRTPGTSDIERQAASQVAKLKLSRSSVGSNQGIIEAVFERFLAGDPVSGQAVFDMCRDRHDSMYSPEFRQCIIEVRLLLDASEHINKSGYHMLYEFAPASVPEPAVVTKRVLHKNAISNLAAIVKLSRTNMANWAEASIMESNRQKLLPPLYPSESIVELREGIARGDAASIGAIPAVAIIGAITAALGAAAGVIASLRADANQLRYNAAGFGQATFGPEMEDFPPPGYPGGPIPGGQFNTGGGLVGNSNFVPLALGAAGLYLLSK